MAVKSFFLRATAALLSAAMLLFVGVGSHTAYDVRDPERCKLHFSVLSDAHIEGNNPTRYAVFVHALRDVRKNRSGNDAVVFLGDNTMNGQAFENLLFHGAARANLRHETVLPVLGNHDVGNGQGDYGKLQTRWYTYTQAFFGRALTRPYYADTVCGCTFIVLGTEAQSVNEIVMTDAQFAWLEGVLEESAQSGRPVFVFAHHPARAAADETNAYTGRLTDILARYSREHDLFSFVGHTHRPLQLPASFRTRDGFPETYLPCLTKLRGEKDNETYEDTGTGVEVEVYGSEVVIRGRDFYRSAWLTDEDSGSPCEVTYPLKEPF